MRRFFSKIIKPLLALAATGAVLASQQGCSKEQKAETPPAAAASETRKPGDGPRVITLTVTEKGYEPSPISLKKDEPVKLVVTRKTEETCATEIVMKDYGINTPLPLNTPVEIAFTPNKTGTLTYGCAMGQMISGAFMVE
ncbi:cupredoxin domain-containing protein [Hyalangium minutum]|uniref:Lead, cadmium, zinc and mercury transporting ATPase n=1 Tax=Hyalangium minutum TaxID=394096 RepID=A0A085VVT2_9BACT|nr:cupredoxin domain-containing protein [Hyalangium minutum]KFE59545.1 Lead, cadmium, zinc and mercury transporting ATPase [Hyalangium minutum]